MKHRSKDIQVVVHPQSVFHPDMKKAPAKPKPVPTPVAREKKEGQS
jgi:hypothetical protein